MNDAGVTPKDLVQNWAFSVEIDGFDAAYFTKADIPKVEMEQAEFAPAGSAFDQKLPSRAKFDDITLDKGVASDGADTAAIDWLTQQMDFVNGAGTLSGDYLRDIAIVEYDRAGGEVRRWNIHGAWIKKYDPGSREGKNSENAIEQITLAYQYYTIG